MSVKISPIKRVKMRFGIVGSTPLLMHAWSEKALKMLRMTPAERRKQPKVARDPEAEGQAAMHRTSDGTPGIPARALKACVINAAHKDIGLEKTLVRKSLFIPTLDESGNLSLTSYSEPVIQEDIVRVSQGGTDLRYRPVFTDWSLTLEVIVDSEALNETDIINLFNRAGFGVGLLEWRPEKGGEYGRFQVDTTVPLTIEEMS